MRSCRPLSRRELRTRRRVSSGEKVRSITRPPRRRRGPLASSSPKLFPTTLSANTPWARLSRRTPSRPSAALISVMTNPNRASPSQWRDITKLAVTIAAASQAELTNSVSVSHALAHRRMISSRRQARTAAARQYAMVAASSAAEVELTLGAGASRVLPRIALDASTRALSTRSDRAPCFWRGKSHTKTYQPIDR